ncbi:GIY-YIG nuclease family protein [Neptuniibacter halophilus]|uniref:GIY-YIG nuclease family protein n=1 Tax=Neptuniibacter halophilus TaxID=651666 RepID=UPI003305AD04
MQHVYVMRDPRNYNDFKVGFSINPIQRKKQMYRTNTPLPFELYRVWAVANQRTTEQIAHARLYDHRINDRREWFEVIPLSSPLWEPGISSDKDLLDVY